MAAQQAEAINAQLLRALPVTQGQLDELWSFVTRKQAQEVAGDGERGDSRPDGRQWIWLSYAPERRLMLATVVGPRTVSSAQPLSQLTAAMIVGVPCFFSDGFSSYGAALLATYHQYSRYTCYLK